MENDVAISVNHVSKSFKLPHEKNSSIKSLVVNFYRHDKSYEVQNVLKDLTFSIKEGEFFGIVGRNGSGKSTLLKLLSGIYYPDKGDITINGRVTPFIELGVGFNPELTGRENVYLNGALLGFSRKEVEAMYDEIVNFSELERFMDQKLKNYSSGMQVRLAFSIAIQAKSEILILDEVLAVGDEAFQQKCISVFERYKAKKQTIILVTHDMNIVERFCSRAMLIKDGEIVEVGSPAVVSKMYSKLNQDDYDKRELADSTLVKLEDSDLSAKIITLDGKKTKRFQHGQSLNVHLSWTRDDVRHIGVSIMKQSGEYVFGTNTYIDKIDLKGSKEQDFKVSLNLGVGEYFLKLGLFGKTDSDILEFIEDGPRFIIENPDSPIKWGGITSLDHEWTN